MLRTTIKTSHTHAYACLLILLAIYMWLFTVAMHGQELPNAQPAVVAPQDLRIHKPQPRPRPIKPDLGSADWFRERGHFKLARFMPVLTHIDWDISYGKSKDTGRSSHKVR